ncbi:pentapeptide repeat-containing protein [Fictibacillus sp. KIGAM418]|uniref:Pentapeptide repeat-containing protein n=1 Tax=Fictibacillus marinisediminis TaxID=2878389 RepID=A0A9X2BC13_9BACL|nr:pentapeptide repeat-containing protein [Fictibacillus marinisediminis]MCK6256434.1 pentapeptide repeat-containing protein [Fictibacillus marinisediminis]
MSNTANGTSQLRANRNDLRADCENCFGLCCTALPFAASADFPVDKDGGVPCSNLTLDFKCSIHQNLRQDGFRGCSVYDCFGAGQKVSKVTFEGKDWRTDSVRADLMCAVFPKMQQLQEMLWYLDEALTLETSLPIRDDLRSVFSKTERLTLLDPKDIVELDIPAHRAVVNALLLKVSELYRKHIHSRHHKKSFGRGADFMGAALRKADFRGVSLRGAYFIASDLREADLRGADLIGADFRDADLRGADLTGSIFLTQAQVNAAKGDARTKLPRLLTKPAHWVHASRKI